jgi:hypothetical protein
MLLDLLTTRHWLFPSISLYTGSHKEQPSLGRPVPSHFIRVRPVIRLPAQANQGPFLASGTGKPGCCCMPRLKNKFFPSLMQKVWSAAAVLQHLSSLNCTAAAAISFGACYSILLSLVASHQQLHLQMG